MRVFVLAATAVCGLLLTGCDNGGGTFKGAHQTASIKAGDTTCDVSATSFKAGEIAFDVENDGKDVTEVYVYGKGSSGTFNKIVGEVENIAPGTSRDFDVQVGGGDYEVACKPGQKGDGIRTTIEVAGAAASTTEAAYDREVDVTATDFAFQGLTGFTAKTGEKIEFKLENTGKAAHTLIFFDSTGKEIGGVEDVEPGQDGEAVVSFEKAGTYTYKCEIGNHAAMGMQGTVTVS